MAGIQLFLFDVTTLAAFHPRTDVGTPSSERDARS